MLHKAEEDLMCGRFATFTPVEAIRRQFRVTAPLPEGEVAQLSWNIAPTQRAWVVRTNRETGDRHLDPLSWGLVPHWTKDLKRARRPVNARAETIRSSPMFRSAFARRRCLVPADAWYEWRKTTDGKAPYAFARVDRMTMALAGVWESWTAVGTGKVLRSFAIITTSANAIAAPVHDRMPVVVSEEDWSIWLGEEDGDPSSVLRPAPDDILDTWPVSRAVSSPWNNGPDLLRRA